MTLSQIGAALLDNLRHWTGWDLARLLDLMLLGWVCYRVSFSKDCSADQKDRLYKWILIGGGLVFFIFKIDYTLPPDVNVSAEWKAVWLPIQNLFLRETLIPPAAYKYVAVFAYLTWVLLAKINEADRLGRCARRDQEAVERAIAQGRDEKERKRQELMEQGRKELLDIEKRENTRLREVLGRFADTFDLENLAKSEQDFLSKFVKFCNKTDPLRRQGNAQIIEKFRRHLLATNTHNQQRELVESLRRSTNRTIREIIDGVPRAMLE